VNLQDARQLAERLTKHMRPRRAVQVCVGGVRDEKHGKHPKPRVLRASSRLITGMGSQLSRLRALVHYFEKFHFS
jgi:hypothetical protein